MAIFDYKKWGVFEMFNQNLPKDVGLEPNNSQRIFIRNTHRSRTMTYLHNFENIIICAKDLSNRSLLRKSFFREDLGIAASMHVHTIFKRLLGAMVLLLLLLLLFCVASIVPLPLARLPRFCTVV